MTRSSRLFALLLSALFPTTAFGEGWSFDNASGDWGKFALGFLSGIAAHEAGHYAVAKSRGYNVSHEGFSIVYPGAQYRGSDQLKIASAGFQTQWLVTEAVFRDRYGKETKEPPSTFGAGVVCAHLGITLAYATILKNQRLGDTYGMAQATSYTKNQLALAVAVPGALDAWRLFGNEVPEWVPQISLMTKGLAIVRVWTY